MLHYPSRFEFTLMAREQLFLWNECPRNAPELKELIDWMCCQDILKRPWSVKLASRGPIVHTFTHTTKKLWQEVRMVGGFVAVVSLNAAPLHVYLLVVCV